MTYIYTISVLMDLFINQNFTICFLKFTNNIHVYKTCLKKAKKCTYVALHQLCDILHIINHLKENTMFDFTKQTKQFEELSKRIQEVNEFWYTIVKEFFNTAKTK
jgi:hypothetical protein